MTIENEFLANIQQEGRIDLPAEEDKEVVPPASPAEKPKEDITAPLAEENKPEGEGEPEDETPEKSEPVVFQAFHKHPRWIALQSELKELRDFREEAGPLLERLGQGPEKREKTVEIPSWFEDLFGHNEESWSKYRDYDTEQRKTLRSEILTEIQKEESQRLGQQKKQEQWVDDELQKLQDDGKTFDRNELLKVANDYLPTDESGSISFPKAYDILEKIKLNKQPAKPTSEEKKKIADQTMKKGKPEEGKRDYKTSADLKGKTFHDLITEE